MAVKINASRIYIGLCSDSVKFISTLTHTAFFMFMLILSSHLRVRLPRGCFCSRSRLQFYQPFSSFLLLSSINPDSFIFLDVTVKIMFMTFHITQDSFTFSYVTFSILGANNSNRIVFYSTLTVGSKGDTPSITL